MLPYDVLKGNDSGQAGMTSKEVIRLPALYADAARLFDEKEQG
jgi:hypothetical protein